MKSGRVGFYLRVLEVGETGEGDAFTRIETDPRAPSIHDLNHAYHFDRGDREVIACALANPALSPAWRKPLEERLS
jgi:MOSC domain-containing protein YiiM